MINLRTRLIIFGLAYVAFVGTATAKSLVIGRVSSYASQTHKQLKPMALGPNVKAIIKDVLLRAHEDPAATTALEAYGPRTAKFDEFIGQAKKDLDDAMDLNRFFARNR